MCILFFIVSWWVAIFIISSANYPVIADLRNATNATDISLFGGYSRAPKEKKSGPFTTSAGFFFKKYSIRFDHCTNFYSISIYVLYYVCMKSEK